MMCCTGCTCILFGNYCMDFYLQVTSLDKEIPHHINPENDYFPVVKGGSKVFLPVKYIQKEDQKNMKLQDDGQKVTGAAVDETESSSEFQDALDTSFDNTGKHLPENLTSLSHNGHSSGSNMYEILRI